MKLLYLRLVLILVAAFDISYEAFKVTQFTMLSVSDGLISVFISATIIWILLNRTKKVIAASFFADKLYLFLFALCCLIVSRTFLQYYSHYVTILINPMTLASLTTLIGGYFIGKLIYYDKLERYLPSLALYISGIGIFLGFVGLIIPNPIVDNINSKLFYILLLLFFGPYNRRYLPVVLLSLFFFIQASVHVDNRTNLIFVLGILIALSVGSVVLKSNLFLRNVVFIASIAFGVVFSFNSEAILSSLMSLEFLNSAGLSSSDTRTFIYEEFFLDINIVELIFGKTLMGTYYSDYFYSIYNTQYGEFGDFYHRFQVEIGVLHIILKNGIVFLILFMMLIVNTIVNSHKLDFRLSMLVFILCMLMFWEFMPILSTRYFLFWLLVGYLNAKNQNRYFEKQRELSRSSSYLFTATKK